MTLTLNTNTNKYTNKNTNKYTNIIDNTNREWNFSKHSVLNRTFFEDIVIYFFVKQH